MSKEKTQAIEIYNLNIESTEWKSKCYNLQKKIFKHEETNKKAIAYIKEHLELKNYSNQKFEYFSREFLEELLKILSLMKQSVGKIICFAL